MKVGTKLILGFLIAVLLVCAVIFLCVRSAYTDMQREVGLLEGDIVPGALIMGEMEGAATEAAHELIDYTIRGKEESKQITLSAIKDLEKLGQEHLEHETHIGQEEQKAAEELMAEINTFGSTVVELINLKEQGASAEELLEQKDAAVNPALDILIAQIREHKAVHMEELAGTMGAVRGAYTSGGLRLVIVTVGLLMVLGTVMVLLVKRSITNPLHALHRGTEMIGEGNLDYKVGTNAKDEIGQLSRAFDQMTSDLKKHIISIDDLNKEITERERVENDLCQERAYTDSVINSMPDMLIIIDQRQEITYINDALAQFTGLEAKMLLGKGIEQVLEGNKLLTPESVVTITERVKRRLQIGEAVTDVEVAMKNSRGEIVFCSYSASAIVDSHGELVGEIVNIRDITKRKQVEEALWRNEERLRLVFGQVPGVLWATDNELRITSAKGAALNAQNIEEAQVLDRNLSEFLQIDDPESLTIVAHRKALNGESSKYEMDFLGVLYDAYVVPLTDTSGKTIGVLGIAMDITERKRAEEELEALLEDLERINRRLGESNQDLQDFVYIASHDLREPLRKIASFGMLLQDSLKGRLDEDEQENFEFMIDGSSRMQVMVDDLLAFSRVTTKEKSFERVDLNNIIEDLKKLEMATLLDEIGGAIHVPEPLLPVHGDLSQMHQLFQNLIGNGLKFHRDGISPEITICARHVGSKMVRVEVQDNGIGISEEYHEQIFTMFKRLHSRTEYEGTGIGLAVCKKIVKRHGGDIGVNSTQGGGTTFWLTLPRENY